MGKDITGQRFGWLVAVRPDGESLDHHKKWFCICDCGGSKTVRITDLTRGKTQSCGCLRREQLNNARKLIPKIHGGCGSRLYRIWSNMKGRCTNPHNKDFPLYGGRGIIICAEWLHDFKAFQKWALSHGYRDDLTIDRMDNDKGYSPDNCRWATMKEQIANRGHKQIEKKKDLPRAPASRTEKDL